MSAVHPDLETHVLEDVVIGVATGTPTVEVADFDLLLTDEPDPPRPWVQSSLADVAAAVESSPAAAISLVHVLRATERLGVAEGLTVESMAYSMLQQGAVFRRWLAERERRERPEPVAEPVRLARTDGRLHVVLHRPAVRNALSAAMRDALWEAFDLADADPSIAEIHLWGDGPSFCSGGDLDEFGSARDPAEAHRVRVGRSVGRRVHEHAGRVTAHVHGACVGAGIELTAFAGRIVAAPDTTALLPEVRLGLIPGAGGTVSIPRRIGRHRTTHLALIGEPIDVRTALAWGLVDEVVDEVEPPPEG